MSSRQRNATRVGSAYGRGGARRAPRRDCVAEGPGLDRILENELRRLLDRARTKTAPLIAPPLPLLAPLGATPTPLLALPTEFDLPLLEDAPTIPDDSPRRVRVAVASQPASPLPSLLPSPRRTSAARATAARATAARPREQRVPGPAPVRPGWVMVLLVCAVLLGLLVQLGNA